MADGSIGEPQVTRAASPLPAAASRSAADTAARWLAAVAWWAAAAPFALWAVVRAAGLERGTPFVQLIAFTPHVTAAALLFLLITLVRRQWWVTALAGVTCVALMTCVAPRMLSTTSPANGTELRVMSMNMREGGADARTIVELVRRERADILALQEFTPDAQARLEAAGVDRLLPYAQIHAVPGIGGSGLYTRLPLSATGTRPNPGEIFQAYGVVALAGAGKVAVESVHPAAPVDQLTVGLWGQGLDQEPRATVDGQRRILVGDFNSSLDHAELRQIVASGYRDAAATVGAGLVPTWPYYGPRRWITPKVVLDHVLADRRIGVRSFSVFPVAHTDHRAILAVLVVPPA
jgi:endonuclease/exonuclease/phosphatase (EEP) superfamily protein YafD